MLRFKFLSLILPLCFIKTPTMCNTRYCQLRNSPQYSLPPTQTKPHIKDKNIRTLIS